jgi:YidC/Oxa1 family membrane protein insertase
LSIPGFNLNWVYTAISWVMLEWHALFSTFLPADGGITWALSIIFLVITARLVLFRFFIKQVKSQRAMQEIQPEIQKLKAQYGSDRQGFSQAVMALQKERGVNPLAGCLPIVPQIPIFIGLLHVLRWLAPGVKPEYGWTPGLISSASQAKIFGVAPISASFNMDEPKKTQLLELVDGNYTGIRIVCVVLIIIMVLTTYTTQRQIQRRSGPVEGQAAMVQKLMLYGVPASLLVSGFFFPIGVLIYWMTNNLWTLGQQFYILRKMPPPGSAGAKVKADGERTVDPKALAPRPGAKPVRTRPARPATTPPADDAAAASPQDAARQDATAQDATPARDGSAATPAADGGASGATAAGGSSGKRRRGDGTARTRAPGTSTPGTSTPSQGTPATGAERPGGEPTAPGPNGSPANGSPANGSAANGSPANGSPAGPGRQQARSGQGPGNRAKRKRR